MGLRKVVCVEDDDAGEDDNCLGDIITLQPVWPLVGDGGLWEAEDTSSASGGRQGMSSRGCG